jgi:hypothetical protein
VRTFTPKKNKKKQKKQKSKKKQKKTKKNKNNKNNKNNLATPLCFLLPLQRPCTMASRA